MAAFKITFLLVLLGAVSLASGVFTCTAKNGQTGTNSYPMEVCYDSDCTKKIVDHIEEELNAAVTYLFMAAYFDQDNVNRPGMAKFLYESASEERQHALLMLDYLNTRGIYYDKEYNFAQTDAVKGLTSGMNLVSALESALKKEIEVTQKIYDIIHTCNLDFHAADKFTDPILEEQHEGIRKLQGAMKTLINLRIKKGGQKAGDKPLSVAEIEPKTADNTLSLAELELGDYLFDQKLLKEGI